MEIEHSSESVAQNKAKQLNQLAGYPRFSVVATPIPGRRSTLRDSYSIKDGKTGRAYVVGSIAGDIGLTQLISELKKQSVDAVSQSSPKSRRLRHDDFNEEYDEATDVEHYGVKGIKWGVRKDPQKAYDRANKKLTKLDVKATKAGAKASRKETRSLRRQQRADTAWVFPKTKAKLADWAIGRSEKSRQKYVKKMSRAVSWHKEMENAFRDTKVDNLNPDYVALGEKYSKIQVNDLMANAQASLANKQLRMIYRQMGR